MAVLRDAASGAIVAAQVDRLSGFRARLVGLLARSSVPAGEGIWLHACGAIHTIGMRAAIDVLFLDRNGCVLQLERHVAPNRLLLRCNGAVAVVELGSGTLDGSALTIGDRLELVPGEVSSRAASMAAKRR